MHELHAVRAPLASHVPFLTVNDNRIQIQDFVGNARTRSGNISSAGSEKTALLATFMQM